MYTTAHRVRDRNTGQTAVHSFLYMHHNNQLFEQDLADQDLRRRVTESEPGDLVESQTELPLGGNSVLSFLDVICPDGTPTDAILKALTTFRVQLARESARPFSWRTADLLLVFSANFGLQRDGELKEYQRLEKALGTLLKKRS